MPETLPAPLQEELSPLTKGIEYSTLMGAVPIASSAGKFVEMLIPTDSVLKSKGATLELYREVLRDDQVKSTFQQRRLSVISAPWEVEPGADDAQSKACAEALAENLKRIEWDRISERMLFSVFYGYGVGEVLWEIRDGLVQIADLRVRDRSRFRFSVERDLLLWNGVEFEIMPDRKFWVVSTGADHDDEPYGLGLAHWLYWPVYFKRNDIKFWLIFLEKFGMPTAVAKLPAGQIQDPAMRAKALSALRAIQVDGGVLVPEGVEITLLEAARSGTATYEDMQQAMDAAIAKIVLSQTMTTDNGSSRSQAEVHEGVRDHVVKADADLLCESFNNGPAKWFAEFNFAGAKPPRVCRRTEPPEDLKSRAERDKKIKALGYEPTEEYIEETYGPGWKKSQAADAMLQGLPGMRRPGQRPEDDPDFAELAALAAVKSIHRNDQRALVDAASAFASKYEQILGDRVRQLVAFAEGSGDYETMRKHLNEILAEGAPLDAVDKIRRANWMSRLLGAFRGQK